MVDADAAADGDDRPGRLIVVSGPSGVGKGTVVRRLLELDPDARLSVSVTTRAPRPQEVDGVDYRFVDGAAFDAMVGDGELLEWATYAGRRYGTPRAPVDADLSDGHDVLLEIEVRGALQVRARRADALLVFLVPPDELELERRLRERGTEDVTARALRLEAARREVDAAGAFDHVVVNDDLEVCVAAVRALIG